MSSYDYIDALKAGKRTYRACLSKGLYPYLPVLDEIISHVDIEQEVNLGVVSIPLKQVVGTSTVGRTNAFANNFMPLLEYGTEFGAKWASLSDSHLEEGIRDPIKVYEYMNRFYVIEGNKRTSVMKFFDAVTIDAEVIRKVPKRTDDLENRIYYEFMEFYRVTGMFNIWVTKEGYFPQLLELTCDNPKEVWDVDRRRDLASTLLSFTNAFEAKGGKKLPITVGDAFVNFIHIYGYDELKSMTFDEIKENIVKIWQEFLMITEEETVGLVMNPAEENKKNILSYLIPSSSKKLKVAFLYDKKPEDSDWIYSHELGRLYIEETFSEQIETVRMDDVKTDARGENALEKAIAGGCEIIFTTTPQLTQQSLKVAIDHPEVKILNCSLNTSHKYIRTYYGRMYEAKFLTGMIAGALAENNRVGYIADYPIWGTISNINAFTLGAKLVNPRIKVYLTWSTKKDFDIEEYYKEKQVSYVSAKDMISPKEGSRKFGFYRCEDETRTNLVMPVWHWGVFYEKLIQSILSGSWKKDQNQEGSKALNYWWGISAGVIDIICSNNVPTETQKLVEILRNLIKTGHYIPFSGELIDQSGQVRNKEGESMTPEEVMVMDWLVQDVVGEIPSVDELVEEARPVVRIDGVLNKENKL